RFIQQEHGWIAHERAGQRHALALTSRKLAGTPVKQAVDPEEAGGPIDLPLDLGPWRTLSSQRKCNVVGDSQVRIKAVALKYHGDATRARRDVIDDFVVDQDVAGRLPLETGDDPQEGRLAAARWAEQHQKLAVADRQADAIDGGDVTE